MQERVSTPLQPSQVLPMFIDGVRDYALLLLDPDGNVTSWNKGAQLIKGYTADEIIGRHFSCFYPPGDVAAGKPQRELDHAAASGRFEDAGYRVRKDGSHFLANVVITAVQGADGELLGYGKVTRDITERVDTEERLRASEARLHTLVDTVVDGLITINRRGVIQSYNKACARLFGYTPDEAIGRNVNMLMPEPDRGRHDGYLSNYLATGTAAIIGIGRDVTGRRKDGSVFPMRLAIGEDTSNDEHVFVGLIHDLTEQRRAQERLRASEEQLQLLIDAAPAAIAMFDRDMRYLAYSQRFVSDYGLGDQPLLGRGHYEVFPEIPERWKEIHRRCMAGAIERCEEDSFPRAEGETDWIRWEVRPWHGPHREIRGIILFSETITERKRAEQVLAETERQLRHAQTMDALGQLTGGVAHDFNNLLGVIIGAAEFLADEVGGQPFQAELVEEIMKSAEGGAELTRRLLAFGRRQALRPTVIDLNGHLAGLIPMLQRTLGETIEVAAAFAAGLWQTRVDPSQINDMLLNLAVNARDAMPAGGRLTIETANAHLSEDAAAQMAEVTPGDYVVLAVTDTGCGMTQDVIAHAIEPFFSTKPPGAGTGLGLSMIYGFAKQSGGHLKIYSEAGVGTTVRLYLPRSPGHDTVAEDATQDGVPLAGGTESILLVDDKAELCAIAARQLSLLGYTTRIAGDGPAALELLRSGERFDLLFTDVVMPGGMNGYQLAAIARQLRPGIAVLFTTGYARAPNPGSVDGESPHLLSKPYHRRQLAESIRAALTRPC